MTSNQVTPFLKASIIAIACTVMLTPASATTIYKSIGEFGEVKYSQFLPKDGVDVEVIELRSNGRQMDTGQYDGKTSAEELPKEQTSATDDEKHIAELENQVKELDQQKVAQRCNTLRNNLSNLSTGGRVYVPDTDGSRKYLDDREAELERERVDKLLNSYCDK